MSTPNLLFFRLAEFLRARKETIVTDAATQLAPADKAEPASRFPWPRRMSALLQETADRLLSRAAMVDSPAEPLPLPPQPAAPDAIKSLLQQGSAVRTSFQRALNRFQVEQADRHDFTALEMTQARQETLLEFDDLLTGSLSTWISRETARTSSLDPHALHEVHEGLKAVQGLLKIAIETVPPQARLHVTAASQQLARLTTRLQEGIGLSAVEPVPAPAVEATPPPPRLPTAVPALAPLPREPLRLAPLHISSFLRTLTDAFRPAAEQKGLRFETRNTGPVPEVIQTDAAKLHRAASLILDHAVRHTQAGSVVMTTGLQASRWMLGVRDTGPSLAPEVLARLLQGLGKGGEETTASDATLGIALARDLTDLLGGAFEAEGGDGTQFRILLPLN